MRHPIVVNPGDFRLLSDERKSGLDISGTVEDNTKAVCGYIRNILPGGNLSDLANETGIYIDVIILLSNYAKTFGELKHHLNLVDPRLISSFNRLNIEEIKAEIDQTKDFSLNQLNQVIDAINGRVKQERADVQAEKKREMIEAKEAGLTDLFEYLELEDNEENRRLIHDSWIHKGLQLGKTIVEYFQEKNITSLDQNNQRNNGLNFLLWLGEKTDTQISYESIQWYGLLTGINPTEPKI